MVELEKETLDLQQQLTVNQEQQAQHQQALLTKQQDLKGLSQKINSLTTQQMTLEQEISNLDHTYNEWKKTTIFYQPDLLRIDSTKIYKGYDKYFFSHKPFTLTAEVKKNGTNEIIADRNKTVNNGKININGQDIYCIEVWGRTLNGLNIHLKHGAYGNVSLYTLDPKNEYFALSLGENAKNVALTPPPVQDSNTMNTIAIKEQELNEITKTLKTTQEELEQDKEIFKYRVGDKFERKLKLFIFWLREIYIK
ncbi:MAG: hypothetical protein AB3N34_01295 [Lettuce witches'-broom phytoplasma]